MKKEYSLTGILILANFVIKKIIDLLINPLVMLELGYFISLMTTTVIYVFFGIISVKIYDSHRTDFFKIEYLKKYRQKNRPKKQRKGLIPLLLRWIKKDKLLFGLFLSSNNPALVVIYRRDGYYLYNGFTGKNVKLFFFINLIIVNIFWNTVLYTGFSIVKMFINMIGTAPT